MSENIRSTNLRFNLDKEIQNRAWQYLQTMDKQRFKSYSNVIAVALVEYFDRYYRSQDDPYLETGRKVSSLSGLPALSADPLGQWGVSASSPDGFDRQISGTGCLDPNTGTLQYALRTSSQVHRSGSQGLPHHPAGVIAHE